MVPSYILACYHMLQSSHNRHKKYDKDNVYV